jgi:Metallo-peptidase family M12B Reprolysin-like
MTRYELSDDPPSPEVLNEKAAAEAEQPYVHIYGPGAVCETDQRGYATPENRSPLELVFDASNGFIPLWSAGVTLRWRFAPRSMALFANPGAARAYLRSLLGRALQLWGTWLPVRFTEVVDRWDFEIALSAQANCTPNGCTLARAFFPDAGRHDLLIYPTMFEQPFQEQVETLAHEVGHVFGLRHFFADITERRWASEIFGEHRPFSIMNYGSKSVMTDNDRKDLQRLYTGAWSGKIRDINGTDIQLVQPFSAAGAPHALTGAVLEPVGTPPMHGFHVSTR